MESNQPVMEKKISIRTQPVGTAICNSHSVAPRQPCCHAKLYSLPRELFRRLEKDLFFFFVHITPQVTFYRGRNDTIINTHKPTWPSHSPFHQSPSLLSMRILECFCTSKHNRMNQSNGVKFVSLPGSQVVKNERKVRYQLDNNLC